MRCTLIFAFVLLTSCSQADSQTPTPKLVAAASDASPLIDGKKAQGKHGTVELAESPDGTKLSLLFNKHPIGEIEANSINGFSDQYFVIGDSEIFIAYQLAGGGCGTYHFISVH